MGALTLQIGNLTRTITAPDAKMQSVLVEVIEATDGPVSGTNTQQADHVLMLLRRHLLELANGNRLRKNVIAAENNTVKLDL
jgi:hypothetical protein